MQAPTGSCETHLSRLFFTPDRVFKLLKPVTLPFVDFADRARRLAAAAEEFERNRAISPDVYLGLADICEHDEVVDRMIVMRRLAAECELTSMLKSAYDPELIRVVARRVASLHAGLEPLVGEAAEPATIDAIARNWEDNFASIRSHVGRIMEPDEFHHVQALARSYMAGREALFEDRVDRGWVRDGHGDLRTEHIYCTEDGPRLIDCVAFDDRLRISDALADVAFLAMDLDRQVGPDAAVSLMRAWNEFTNEHHPSSLAHFYVAYRAHVRCKIACLRHEAGQPGASVTARDYHAQALEHLQLARIRMVMVGGGPGTGKSTIAEAVADRLGAVWLRADEIRKDIAHLAHDEHEFVEPDQGIYSPEMGEKVYAELRRQASLLLANGVSVVLDATWRSNDEREATRQVAAQSAATLSELRCVLPDAVAKERIARRMASVYNPSDATPELVDVMSESFEDWPEAATVDTGVAVADSIDAAVGAVAPRLVRVRTSAGNVEVPARFVVDLAALRTRVLLATGLPEPQRR